MSILNQFSKHLRTAGACSVFFSILVAESTVMAHGGSHDGGTPAAARAAASNYNTRPDRDLKLNPSSLQPMYGGQVTATKWHFVEVVYKPKETRIYVYSPSRRALSARGMRGKVEMKVNGRPKRFHYKLKQATDKNGRVYGSVAVDVTHVFDGDMEVTFELNRLPFKEEKQAKFKQTFHLTRSQVSVTKVPLVASDWPLVQQQRVCPVMDTDLSDHGGPIKLIVGDQPVFVCCEGCIAEVSSRPHHFVEKTVSIMASRPRIAVLRPTPSDDAAIRDQATCPVTNQPLGDHGQPLKVVIDGQPIFVCCKGCVNKLRQQPDQHLSKLFADNLQRLPVVVPSGTATPTLPGDRASEDVTSDFVASEATRSVACSPRIGRGRLAPAAASS